MGTNKKEKAKLLLAKITKATGVIVSFLVSLCLLCSCGSPESNRLSLETDNPLKKITFGQTYTVSSDGKTTDRNEKKLNEWGVKANSLDEAISFLNQALMEMELDDEEAARVTNETLQSYEDEVERYSSLAKYESTLDFVGLVNFEFGGWEWTVHLSHFEQMKNIDHPLEYSLKILNTDTAVLLQARSFSSGYYERDERIRTKLPEGVIYWKDIDSYIGQTVTVYGQIMSIDTAFNESGKPTFFDIGNEYPQNRLSAVVWWENYDNFGGDIYSYFRDYVFITGEVYLYNGTPFIEITTPSQIEVVQASNFS